MDVFFDTEEAHAVMLAHGADEWRASCFKGDSHFSGCGSLQWGRAPAWISGTECAHSTFLARPVE